MERAAETRDRLRLQQTREIGTEVTAKALPPVFDEKELTLRQAQRTRAQRPRGKVAEDGKTLGEVIAELALKPEHQEEAAKELWPHFLAELDELGLSPDEKEHPTDLRKCACQYSPLSGRPKEITFGRFANVVSNARKQKKSR